MKLDAWQAELSSPGREFDKHFVEGDDKQILPRDAPETQPADCW